MSFNLNIYGRIPSSNEVLKRGLLLLQQIVFVKLVPDLHSHMLPLPIGGHVHVVLRNLHGIEALLLLLGDCPVAVLDVLLVDAALDGLLLQFGLLLLGLLVLDKLLGLLLVGFLELDFLLLAAEDGHLAVLSYLLQFLLLVRLLRLELGLLLLLEGVVLIADLLWLAVHDVTLVGDHFVCAGRLSKNIRKLFIIKSDIHTKF